MITTLALAALLASGPGARLGAGPVSVPRSVGPFRVDGGLLAGGIIFEWPAPRDAFVTGMVWNESTAGIGTTMTYRLAIDGVEACAITVACDVAVRQEMTCAAEVPIGAVVRLDVKTDNCALGNPAGGILVSVE